MSLLEQIGIIYCYLCRFVYFTIYDFDYRVLTT